MDFTIEVQRSLRVLTVRLQFLTHNQVLSLKLKQFGVKQLSTEFHVMYVPTNGQIGADFISKHFTIVFGERNSIANRF